MSALTANPTIGIYEKALAPGTWLEMLSSADRAGYDFMEISVDESSARMARLEWDAGQRAELREAIEETGVRVPTLCLSGHRKYGLGSREPEVREHAQRILQKAIRLADGVGIRVIQVAGYFAYYEEPDPGARARYIEGLAAGASEAGRYGVMLAVENIDTADVGSIRAARGIVAEVDSPWLTIYPDVGNVAVNGLDVLADLRNIGNTAVGIHLKDTRLGQPRRVPFGSGVVPFPQVFRELKAQHYTGPFMVEMWNDDPATADQAALDARLWLEDAMQEAA